EHRHPAVVLGATPGLRHQPRRDALRERRADGCPGRATVTTALLLGAARGVTPLVLALVIAAAVLALGFAIALMTGERRGRLEMRLGELMREPTLDEPVDEIVPRDQALAETALMQRMVGLTGRLAERAGVLARTEAALEQADVPLRPPEALFFYV